MWKKADILISTNVKHNTTARSNLFQRKKIGISFVNIWPQKLKSELAMLILLLLFPNSFLQEFQNI